MAKKNFYNNFSVKTVTLHKDRTIQIPFKNYRPVNIAPIMIVFFGQPF
jgi:hypothetical protein